MPVAGKPGRIKEDPHNSIYELCGQTPIDGAPGYRSSDTDQYASAATPAEAGMVITQA
jgi:hypothetical protein